MSTPESAPPITYNPDTHKIITITGTGLEDTAFEPFFNHLPLPAEAWALEPNSNYITWRANQLARDSSLESVTFLAASAGAFVALKAIQQAAAYREVSRVPAIQFEGIFIDPYLGFEYLSEKQQNRKVSPKSQQRVARMASAQSNISLRRVRRQLKFLANHRYSGENMKVPKEIDGLKRALAIRSLQDYTYSPDPIGLIRANVDEDYFTLNEVDAKHAAIATHSELYEPAIANFFKAA